MIDLTKKSLPNTIRVDGRDFSIYTDFRKWIKFENEVMRMKSTDRIDVSYLFKNEMPTSINLNDLFAFSRPQSELPRARKESNVRAIDYMIDADYIYSAFVGQYGIDLTTVEDLHFHKFIALIKGLNSSTRMYEIMQSRCYEKDTRKNVDIYAEARDAWSLEIEENDEDLEEFNKMFGG